MKYNLFFLTEHLNEKLICRWCETSVSFRFLRGCAASFFEMLSMKNWRLFGFLYFMFKFGIAERVCGTAAVIGVRDNSLALAVCGTAAVIGVRDNSLAIAVCGTAAAIGVRDNSLALAVHFILFILLPTKHKANS
jgi:hypothetical protein